MKTIKTLEQLTIKDNFMFGAVMCNVEKRSRYYHSQVDMELLSTGEEYDNLPNAFVIFICDFDPFGKGLYCYTFENQCLEYEKLKLEDGRRTVFLSTKGKNQHEVSENLVKFLEFVKADLKESEKDFGDPFVGQLQNSVRIVKESREMGERFMVFREMMRDERNEGRAEGKLEARKEDILELLGELGSVPDSLRQQILSENDLNVLQICHKKAARAESFDQFLLEVEEIFGVKE